MRIMPQRVALRTYWASCNLDTRALVVGSVFASLCVGLLFLSVSVGYTQTSFADMWSALTGNGDIELRQTILEWRLPRVLSAIFVGSSVALAGALFQSLTRNPLCSPDIIGFNAGAFAGVIIAAELFGGERTPSTLSALAGGFIVAILVYFLSLTRTFRGLRLVIVGISLNAIISSFNTYMKSIINVEISQNISIWGVGSLSLITWSDALLLYLTLIACVSLAVIVIPKMRVLEMGDDNAASLGVSARSTLTMMIVIAVVLTAVSTTVVGPISFVALTAPHIAKFLVGSKAINIFPTIAVGGFLLAASDLIARTIIAPSQLPTGVVTIVFGGAYLLYLSIRGANDYRR